MITYRKLYDGTYAITDSNGDCLGSVTINDRPQGRVYRVRMNGKVKTFAPGDGWSKVRAWVDNCPSCGREGERG